MPVLRALREDAALVPEARPEPHRGREGAAAGRVQARRRLPQGAARRADEADRAHRPQRPAVHRDRHRRLHHGQSPYTARGYGIFDEVKGKFKNPDDPFEYVPVKLKALVGRSKDAEPGIGDRLLSARRAAQHVPVPAPLPDDGDEPQPPAGADVLPALPRRRRAGTGRPRLRRRRGHGEVRGPDDAGRGVRRLPQDARPGRRAVPGLLAVRGPGRLRQAEGRLVHGHVRRRLRGRGPAGGGALAGAAVARRAHGEGPALRRRDGRARLLHPHRPQGAAAAEGPRRSALSPRSGGPTRSSAAQIEAIAGPLREGRLQPQERLQGLGRLRLLPRRRPGDRGEGPEAAGRAGRRRAGADARARAGRAEGRRRLRRAVGQADRADWRCSTAASTRRKSPSGPPTRAGRWARSSASWRTTWRASTSPATSPARRPSGGCSPASSRTCCPAPRPRATRRSARRSSTCTSACWAGTTPPDSAEVERTFELFAGIVADAKRAEGDREAGELLLPAGQGRPSASADDPHYTDPGLARRGHVPAAAAASSCTSNR